MMGLYIFCGSEKNFYLSTSMPKDHATSYISDMMSLTIP
jgi:hypothetical protein